MRVVKIEGHPCLYDDSSVQPITVTAVGNGIWTVEGTYYPDDHPALDSGNTSWFNEQTVTDATALVPIGKPYSTTGNLNLIADVDIDVVQLFPFKNQKIEDQIAESGLLADGPLDPAG